jgi:hypothetical protein
MEIQTQQKHFWCWAAVAVSVEHYLDTGSTLTQCDLAQKVFPNDHCVCADPQSCNFEWYLDDALAKIGRLEAVETGQKTLSFQEVKDAVDAHLPVCVAIEWAQGGGHFVAIDGYGTSPAGVPVIDVLDPAFGEGWIWDFDSFLNSYDNIGHWSATFTVKRKDGDD